MAGTFTHLAVHVVFSTKGRAPLIDDELRPRLYAYMGGIVRANGATCLDVGGVADHVHLLVRMRAVLAVSALLREVKSGSSKWMNEERPSTGFAWQGGYSAFSVSASNVAAVSRYIRRQAEHHRTMSFEDELRRLLAASGVEFDERYLID